MTTAAMTKEELQAENEALKVRLTAQEEHITKLSRGSEGWLVTTPNPIYEGLVHGIQFINGQAFIMKGREVPDFVIPAMKPTQLEKFTKEEQAKILEREKMSSAERATIVLASDFGYKVEYFKLDEMTTLQTKIDARAIERAETEAAIAAAKNARAVVPPGYIGG